MHIQHYISFDSPSFNPNYHKDLDDINNSLSISSNGQFLYYFHCNGNSLGIQMEDLFHNRSCFLELPGNEFFTNLYCLTSISDKRLCFLSRESDVLLRLFVFSIDLFNAKLELLDAKCWNRLDSEQAFFVKNSEDPTQFYMFFDRKNLNLELNSREWFYKSLTIDRFGNINDPVNQNEFNLVGETSEPICMSLVPLHHKDRQFCFPYIRNEKIFYFQNWHNGSENQLIVGHALFEYDMKTKKSLLLNSLSPDLITHVQKGIACWYKDCLFLRCGNYHKKQIGSRIFTHHESFQQFDLKTGLWSDLITEIPRLIYCFKPNAFEVTGHGILNLVGQKKTFRMQLNNAEKLLNLAWFKIRKLAENNLVFNNMLENMNIFLNFE